MPESLQHKLDRVRRPRVQITYDVETGGAMQKIELPFVVGVLADLSGQPKQALRPLKERKAVNIDRDNFNDVLTRAGARLALRVANRLTDPNSKLAVELNFKHIDDFEPARVAEQIGPLKQLLEMRQELTQLLSRMEGNDKLEQLLDKILKNQEMALKVAQHIDGQVEDKPAPSPAAAALQKAPAAVKPPPAPAAAKPPPSPAEAPAEAAAPDAELEALLGGTESAASPQQPAGESAASASAPAAGGESDLDDLLKQVEGNP
jgi:type VI secretion system protein ImpB